MSGLRRLGVTKFPSQRDLIQEAVDLLLQTSFYQHGYYHFKLIQDLFDSTYHDMMIKISYDEESGCAQVFSQDRGQGFELYETVKKEDLVFIILYQVTNSIVRQLTAYKRHLFRTWKDEEKARKNLFDVFGAEFPEPYRSYFEAGKDPFRLDSN